MKQLKLRCLSDPQCLHFALVFMALAVDLKFAFGFDSFPTLKADTFDGHTIVLSLMSYAF